MKQTIPFKKDITFKTKIGELTAISLDNDLTLKGEDLIVGNFYISGNYKILEGSLEEESYSYKIPCEIAISEEYDTYDATIDIDDFYYEIINDEILRVNITVVISNLERKELPEERNVQEEIEVLRDDPEEEEVEVLRDEDEKDKDNEVMNVFKEEIKLPLEDNSDIKVIDKMDNERNSFLKQKDDVSKQSDTYLTYKVYIYKEEDTIEKVLSKYKITKDQLSDYNDLEDIIPGSKLVIPSSND